MLEAQRLSSTSVRNIHDLIIHMQKFQQAHWLRARQLIPNSAES